MYEKKKKLPMKKSRMVRISNLEELARFWYWCLRHSVNVGADSPFGLMEKCFDQGLKIFTITGSEWSCATELDAPYCYLKDDIVDAEDINFYN